MAELPVPVACKVIVAIVKLVPDTEVAGAAVKAIEPLEGVLTKELKLEPAVMLTRL